MGDVTLMLEAVKAGEAGAQERLWETVYEEVRRMAAEKMAGESREVTLSATALVHEAWLRLSGPAGTDPAWDGRAHFFAAAAEAMRRILVDQARRRLSQKRGGGHEHVPLELRGAMVTYARPDAGANLRSNYTAHYDNFSINAVPEPATTGLCCSQRAAC